jgi:hypothetical protein
MRKGSWASILFCSGCVGYEEVCLDFVHVLSCQNQRNSGKDPGYL